MDQVLEKGFILLESLRKIFPTFKLKNEEEFIKLYERLIVETIKKIDSIVEHSMKNIIETVEQELNPMNSEEKAKKASEAALNYCNEEIEKEISKTYDALKENIEGEGEDNNFVIGFLAGQGRAVFQDHLMSLCKKKIILGVLTKLQKHL